MFNFMKKQKLLALQNLVMTGSPNKLVMSEKEIYANANRIVQNALKVMNESADLVNNTLKPDVFFKRYNILIEYGEKLVQFEPYVKFKGTSPTNTLKDIKNQRHQATLNFLERYYQNTELKATSLKTERGKQNAYQKFFDSLKAYSSDMDEETLLYISNLQK